MSKIPERKLWIYRAELVSVVDADTVKLKMDLGFHTSCVISLRIKGVDSPELRGGTKLSKMAAKRAKFFTEEWFKGFDEEWPFVVETEKGKKSFDRFIGDVWRPKDRMSLGEALLDSNHAVVF